MTAGHVMFVLLQAGVQIQTHIHTTQAPGADPVFFKVEGGGWVGGGVKKL